MYLKEIEMSLYWTKTNEGWGEKFDFGVTYGVVTYLNRTFKEKQD